jgi:hypothetical protein
MLRSVGHDDGASSAGAFEALEGERLTLSECRRQQGLPGNGLDFTDAALLDDPDGSSNCILQLYRRCNTGEGRMTSMRISGIRCERRSRVTPSARRLADQGPQGKSRTFFHSSPPANSSTDWRPMSSNNVRNSFSYEVSLAPSLISRRRLMRARFCSRAHVW